MFKKLPAPKHYKVRRLRRRQTFWKTHYKTCGSTGKNIVEHNKATADLTSNDFIAGYGSKGSLKMNLEKN